MKLIRFGEEGVERPGIELPDGERRDLSGFGEDYDERFFRSDGVRRLAQWLLGNLGSAPIVPPSVRLGAPICRPSKIVCIGLNYQEHVEETKARTMAEPVLFLKATSALCGPYDNLQIPPDSTRTDYEVELAVIIGKRAKHVLETESLSHVAGYAVMCDYSERHYQKERSGQWTKGKSYDSFAPLGPWLVTADEVADPQNLRLQSRVNGECRQNSSTSQMIFPVSFLISYISQFMTLLPGDIISTGTPSGVGLADGRFLKPGDVVELSIEGLGTSRQVAV
jgi:2-keto-4-pentenoate hydratase/2-oxohepta-3-ene-1,7-dioic acid hydratase in catechol pathway